MNPCGCIHSQQLLLVFSLWHLLHIRLWKVSRVSRELQQHVSLAALVSGRDVSESFLELQIGVVPVASCPGRQATPSLGGTAWFWWVWSGLTISMGEQNPKPQHTVPPSERWTLCSPSGDCSQLLPRRCQTSVNVWRKLGVKNKVLIYRYTCTRYKHRGFGLCITSWNEDVCLYVLLVWLSLKYKINRKFLDFCSIEIFCFSSAVLFNWNAHPSQVFFVAVHSNHENSKVAIKIGKYPKSLDWHSGEIRIIMVL